MYPICLFIEKAEVVCSWKVIYCNDVEMSNAVAWEVEVSGYCFVMFFLDVVFVASDSFSECVFCLSYILFVAFGAGDEIDNVVGTA